MKRKWKDINEDWFYRIGIVVSVLTLTMMTCFSCRQKTIDYRYRIHGQVRMSTNPKDSLFHPAIWMTDTFRIVNDTLIITNSDSSQWRVAPPYKIESIK
jgi:hypothetical protein